ISPPSSVPSIAAWMVEYDSVGVSLLVIGANEVALGWKPGTSSWMSSPLISHGATWAGPLTASPLALGLLFTGPEGPVLLPHQLLPTASELPVLFCRPVPLPTMEFS